MPRLSLQAHISASLILNGVAVKWVGHIDLERLEGTGRVEFDHQLAKVSDTVMHVFNVDSQDLTLTATFLSP